MTLDELRAALEAVDLNDLAVLVHQLPSPRASALFGMGLARIVTERGRAETLEGIARMIDTAEQIVEAGGYTCPKCGRGRGIYDAPDGGGAVMNCEACGYVEGVGSGADFVRDALKPKVPEQ